MPAKQGTLTFAARAPKREKRAPAASANRAAAEIILADVAAHGGEGTLAVEWARRVIARQA